MKAFGAILIESDSPTSWIKEGQAVVKKNATWQ